MRRSNPGAIPPTQVGGRFILSLRTDAKAMLPNPTNAVVNRRAMHTAHKWLAISVGLFFLVWILSGVVMILPPPSYGPPPERAAQALDLGEELISPTRAIAGLQNGAEVHAVTLRRILDTPVYEIATGREGPLLVSARSGEVFTITAGVAEQIIRTQFPSESRVLQTELVTNHSLTYAWGPVPAYRIAAAGQAGTTYYVSAGDGEVRRSNRWSRVQEAIASLHTFEPLKLLTRRERVRKGLLLLMSAIGIGAAGTGYYLAVPRRRRRSMPAEPQGLREHR
jgi:hypothetical protein